MAQPSILFVEKVFLKRRRAEPLRGVELFNLCLARDLGGLGFAITLVADRSWEATVGKHLAGGNPERLWPGASGSDLINGALTALRLRGRRFDTLLLGNVGDGLIPAIGLLRRLRVFDRVVLIAHREASPRFVRCFPRLPGHVLAVNQQIARPFLAAGCRSVHVDYGIMNADRFAPRASPRGDKVRFCVLGMLDNAWKGADTAVAAFRLLPADLREQCELHLYSYTAPPAFPEPGIHAYSWIDVAAIPDMLRSMDVMLVPSRDEGVMRETFSQAMVQGMLTALPVIVSDRPILVEKVDDGAGLVFHSVEQLADHMARLARDAALRRQMGERGRQTALARYVWDTARFAARYLPPT